ncbi:uncharacterized protein LOC120340051 [Styela clava]
MASPASSQASDTSSKKQEDPSSRNARSLFSGVISWCSKKLIRDSSNLDYVSSGQGDSDKFLMDTEEGVGDNKDPLEGSSEVSQDVIDTSKTDQDGFTYSAEHNDDPKIAKLEKEFEEKKIASDRDSERRNAAMRRRYAKQNLKARINLAEDVGCEVPPKKTYVCSETKHVGLCIIINNITKYLRPAASLRKFFTSAGYKVEFHECLKMESIFNPARSRNFDDYGCLVCFVLSTGNDRLIETADNSSITMNEVVQSFNPDEFPSLNGKPKVFFFQNRIDIYDDKNLWNDDEPTTFPTYADTFVLRSTLRDFIKIFAEILTGHPRKSLSTIMTLLQYEILYSFTNNERYHVISTLAKEVRTSDVVNEHGCSFRVGTYLLQIFVKEPQLFEPDFNVRVGREDNDVLLI